MSLYFPNLKMRLTFRKKAIKMVNDLSIKSYEDSHNVKNAKKIINFINLYYGLYKLLYKPVQKKTSQTYFKVSSRFRSKTLTTFINKVEIKN